MTRSRIAKTPRKVTTVWLANEIGHSGEDRTRMFFCFNCRIPVVQYKGQVISIVPGMIDYEPCTLLACKGSKKDAYGSWEQCGYVYSFMDSVHTRYY